MDNSIFKRDLADFFNEVAQLSRPLLEQRVNREVKVMFVTLDNDQIQGSYVSQEKDEVLTLVVELRLINSQNTARSINYDKVEPDGSVNVFSLWKSTFSATIIATDYFLKYFNWLELSREIISAINLVQVLKAYGNKDNSLRFIGNGEAVNSFFISERATRVNTIDVALTFEHLETSRIEKVYKTADKIEFKEIIVYENLRTEKGD